ncbi:hypothetical protein [Mycobacterium sp. ENV421]|uniref:hypothetical protein n=1 Tax=Mycobacterium sp. ENV421 TaxID=1213407 RepID=UPI0018ED38EA|nr:hypothetical protein [Mycobacterium sp. ENV421]
MTTSTILLIVVIVVAALVLVAAIAVVARNKRIQSRRAEAADIRDKATEDAHMVRQREALADEIAARGRVAQAEADAKAAHAEGLEHQAHIRRNDASTARDKVNEDFERADKIDPDTHRDDTPREDAESQGSVRDIPASSNAAHR